MKTLLALTVLVACACGARTRPIIYPSPCSDRLECRITGWEAWGDDESIREAAADFCEGYSAIVQLSWPHRDYGLIRCVRQRGTKVMVEYSKDSNFVLP